MSWVRIWVHMVFSTKNREHYLQKEIREQLLLHIKDNASKKEIWLDDANGYIDHLHCLISLGREQTISSIAQLIKGESNVAKAILQTLAVVRWLKPTVFNNLTTSTSASSR